MPTIEEGEQAARKAVLADWGNQLKAAEQHLNSQLQLWNKWGSVKSPSWVEAGLLLWARSFDSLYCAQELMIKGYWIQSATLLRQVWEDQLTSLYMIEHDKTIADEFYKDEGTVPKFSDMADRLGPVVKKWWKDGYPILSKLAHPRSYAVGSRWKNGHAVIGPAYERHDYSGLVGELLGAIVRSTGILRQLVCETDITHVETELLTKLTTEREELNKIIAGIP